MTPRPPGAPMPTSEIHKDHGRQRRSRLLGRLYGYPSCCIEAFATTPVDLLIGAPHHPESGHVLCPARARGPLAPLPERPGR